MNDNRLADVLILARGGGSLEDLWPFNEEVVARAIYASELPIISAVGHETDFSISDFVADLRAPTPSAAAELAVADTSELKIKLDNYKTRYKLALKKKVELMRLQYEKCMARRVFKEPLQEINEKSIRLDMIVKNMQNAIENKYKDSKNEMIKLVSKLDTLSPLKTLTRGYSITQKGGVIVKSANDLNKDDEIELRFVDGNKKAKVM
jgi:exodeoxyribonuclease VII large subunit